ncbi:MAG: hypothetical protein K2M48_02670 [Clostridiales bacterium]|nr:hypothetical protein [Clostridiales bacterium]
MKGKLLVVFYSKHGYVQRYVDIIGNALGCDAVPADKLRGDMLVDYDKILYIGSLKNNEINGLKKFGEFFDAIYKKLVICGVGLSPFRNYLPHRIKETSVSVTYEKFVPVFYAQGGFDIDELSRLEKFAISWRVKQIKTASVINDDDTFLMNAVKTPVDEVKLSNIQPLIDYLEGNEVDETLYSPPEITDPEEEKKFFEELDKAVDAPTNGQRALKKKLKKGFGKSSAKQSEDEQPATEPEAQQAKAEEQQAEADGKPQEEPASETEAPAEPQEETAEQSEKAE